MPASTSGYPVRPSFHAASACGVVDPAVAARAEVVDLRPWPRPEELAVEVPPAELPDERARRRAPRRDSRARGRRCSRSGGTGRGATSRRPRGRRASARRRPRRRASQASIRLRPAASPPGKRRAPAGARAAARPGRPGQTQPAWRAEVVASWRGAPRAVVGREHLVVVAPGRRDRARRDDEGAVHEPQVDLMREAALALAGVGAHICRRENRVGPDSAHRRHRLRDDVTAANVERPADPPERLVEVGEALVEEGAPAGGSAVACLANAVVEDEERVYPLGSVERGPEHRVVVQSKVAGEEGDGGSHGTGGTSLDLYRSSNIFSTRCRIISRSPSSPAPQA